MPSAINEHTQYLDSSGTPIASGSVYIGTQNLNPVSNPITIYSDRDLTTAISNPQTLDAQGRTTNKIWVPGRYSLQVNDASAVQQYQSLDEGEVVNTSGFIGLDTVSGTNSITAEGALDPVTTLTDGQQYIFKAASTITGSATLQIDLTAAKTIKKQHDQDLVAGDIEQNQTVAVVYNGTEDVFELVSGVATSYLLNGLVLNETADHIATPVTGAGEIWLESSTPQMPKFTDESGSDKDLLSSEGSWTPTLQDTSFSDAESQTYGVQNALYWRFGDLIHIQATITVSSLGALTTGDAAYIAGLPFNSIGLSGYASTINVGDASGLAIAATDMVSGITVQNTDRIALKVWDQTTGPRDMLISDISADGSLTFSGTYITG